MRLPRLFICLIPLVLAAGPALAADLVLVGNPDSGLTALQRDQVVNIYMGRFRELPNGLRARPLDHTAYRKTFYRQVVGKRLPEIDAYWARLVFSGRGSPPRQVDNADEMLDAIADNPGAIGYLPREEVDSRGAVLADLDALTDD